MDTDLLRLFRLAETRLHESDRLAVLDGRGLSPLVLRRRARFYQFLAELPLWLRPREGVFIPNIGSPVGKAAIAAREISDAAPADAGNLITSNVPQWAPMMYRAARVLVRLPRASLIAAWLRWKHPGLGRYRRSVVVGVDAMQRFLQRHPRLHPLVISDVSPLLAMLALAAYREGNRGIWWQDDYHHTSAPPFPFGYGCFLNQVAMENAVAGARVVGAFRRPVPAPKPVRAPGSKPAVGVAVNASFGGTANEWRVLRDLRDALQTDVLHLRLHPNSALVPSAVPMSWIEVADCSETMAAFARRIDLAVVGNSASQLRLLIEGVPVLHLGGLDPLEYDLYGYVDVGLLPGADLVSRISLGAIRDFYSSPEYLERIRRRVGFIGESPESDLAALVSTIAKKNRPVIPWRYSMISFHIIKIAIAKILGRSFLGKASLFVVRQARLIANPHRYKVIDKKTFSPTLSLRPCHVHLCSVKATREDLLDLVPTGAVCAEVGVAAGFFSRIILDRVQPTKLYLIEYSEDACHSLRKNFSKEIESNQVVVLEGDSAAMLTTLPDASLDFCYLDAVHDYEHPARELKICRDKVKPKGLIAGHDYTRFSIWEQQQYGVVEAVNEFIVRENLKLVAISLDILTSNMSYCIENSGRMDLRT